MNFENVLNTLYELYKDMSVDQLEGELREWPSKLEIGASRIIIMNKVIIALIETRRQLKKGLI